MNSDDVISLVKSLEIDLIINLRTRCIYKKEILSTPRLGCINIHHGILPKYRGTFCDLYAMYEEREAGFSIHKMSEKVDAGDIYYVHSSPPGKNYIKYLAQTSKTEGLALSKVLTDMTSSKQQLIPNSLPSGEKPIYTKNPTKKLVNKMRKKGIIL